MRDTSTFACPRRARPRRLLTVATPGSLSKNASTAEVSRRYVRGSAGLAGTIALSLREESLQEPLAAILSFGRSDGIVRNGNDDQGVDAFDPAQPRAFPDLESLAQLRGDDGLPPACDRGDLILAG